MFNYLKRKMKEDKGNAVIVLGFVLIMATLLVGGMLLDVSKAYQMKSSYHDSALKATQTAVRHQNSSGFLKAEAAAEAIRVYENVSRPSVIKEGYMSACSLPRNVKITVYFMKDEFTRGSHTITINSNQVNNHDSLDSILSKARVNGLTITNTRRNSIEAYKYTGIEMELYETTPNVLLPGALTISGSDGDDMRCQKIGVKAGASQYIGEHDKYH